jgi:hypothetical protein
MNCIGTILERRRRPSSPRRPRLSEAGSGKLRAAAAFARRRSFLGDQRGAVAFETLIVYLFMVTALLLPLADVAAAGFQFISGWEALRGFGQYVQYFPLSDPTNFSAWPAGKTVAGYTISNVKVVCGDVTPPVACTDATKVPKYYSYTTTVTLAPIALLDRSILCTSSNANPCSYTLNYSERFQ